MAVSSGYMILLMLLSSFMGFVILAEDALSPTRFIWESSSINAPIPHAYALVAFIIVDLILALTILAEPIGGTLAASLWSILQVLAMAFDPLTAPSYNLTVIEFASYLFGIWSFDVLLVLRIVTAATGLLAYVKSSRGPKPTT